MLPHLVNEQSLTFLAQGQMIAVAADHAYFETIKSLLVEGCEDERKLIAMADVRVAVEDITNGRAQLSEAGLTVDGVAMPETWAARVAAVPAETKILLVRAGDRVRVEGDEDAPDGIYTVGDVDNDDLAKRVYVESDEDYFGFVANSSIVEILA